MICPKCGREIPDGTVCPCSLEVQAPVLSDNPALNALKTVGSSPLFLAMAVLFSLSALLTIFSSLGVADALSTVYMYTSRMGLDMDQIEAMLDAMRYSSTASTVLGSIPAILIAAAMWIHFSTCRSRQSGNISTAGLTICKVLFYISMISLCLGALLIAAGFAIIIIAFLASDLPLGQLFDPYGSYSYGGSYTDEEATIAVVVVLAVVALIFIFIMVLAITYQASFIRTINRAKAVAQSGIADDRVSGYLTGMTGLVAAVSILSGIGAMFASPMTGAASIIQGAAYILVIVLLRQYGKAMNQVLYPPVPPMAQNMYGYPGYPAPVQQAPVQQPVQPADGFQAPPQPPQQDEDQPPQGPVV